MSKYNSISLLGDNSININSLEGSTDNEELEYIEKIQKYNDVNKFVSYSKNTALMTIQKKIYNNLLFPLLKYDFKSVTNNYHLYQHYNLELLRCRCYSKEEQEEKTFYKELLKFIDLSKNSNEKLEKFNLKEYGGTMGFIVNLAAVTLKSEYIIYDNILGKPEKLNYDPVYIKQIKKIIKKNPETEYSDLYNQIKQEYHKNI